MRVEWWNKTQDNIDYLRGRVDGGVTVPSGAILSFNLKECPTGWLPANGSGSIAGESIPDLRGEFIRGLDNGRGIDINRVLGSNQEDMFKSHHHDINYYSGVGASWDNYDTKVLMHGTATNSISSSNILSTGGIETRPRNIALLYCIKE